jgi:hypothetical protein
MIMIRILTVINFIGWFFVFGIIGGYGAQRYDLGWGTAYLIPPLLTGAGFLLALIAPLWLRRKGRKRAAFRADLIALFAWLIPFALILPAAGA